ncbi:MAG: outer membrane protein assembly factor BamA, partial [Candidatus Hinthialibacter sp.]
KSYPNTTLEWTTRPGEEPNTIVLVFQIKEGERLPVKKIVFTGNKVIHDKALRKVMETKESFWFIFKRQYDEAAAKEDLRRIEELAYADIGYLDAKAAIASVSEEDNGLTITFQIEEGEPYVVGDISLSGNSIFSDEELLSRLQLRPGDLFSAGTMYRNVNTDMMNLYRGQGYLDVSIPYRLLPDRENHIVNVAMQVEESSRKFLGKVEIQGGVTLEDGTWVPTQEGEFRTKDFVIEREIELEEGEPIDWTKVIESDRNLVNLNYFKSRGIPIPGQTNLIPGFQRDPIASDPSTENLILRLEEKETGALSFGVGVSTSYGPSIFSTLSERNMFGYGVQGSITGELGEVRNRLALNIFEPHLLNSDYSLDWDIYYIDQEGYGGRRFEEQRIGTKFTFGKELTDELTLLFGTKAEITDLKADEGHSYSLDPATIPEVYNLGENTTTSLLIGYIYDTRDFKIDPRNGIYSRSTFEAAGLTDNEFVKLENLLNYYRPFPFYDKMVLAFSGEFDLAHAYGDPGFIPLQERFFAGGSNSIRGFDDGGIGDSAYIRYLGRPGGYRSYLGGEAAFIGNVEVRYPITEIFQVVSFLDMGTVWPEIGDIDPSEFRFSTGMGMRIRIPGINAMIRFDFGVPIRKYSDDDTEFFHFSFGQSF